MDLLWMSLAKQSSICNWAFLQISELQTSTLIWEPLGQRVWTLMDTYWAHVVHIVAILVVVVSELLDPLFVRDDCWNNTSAEQDGYLVQPLHSKCSRSESLLNFDLHFPDVLIIRTFLRRSNVVNIENKSIMACWNHERSSGVYGWISVIPATLMRLSAMLKSLE